MEAAAARQDRIGWDHLLRGRLSQGWATVRTAELAAPDIQWTTKVVRALWEYTYGAWRHRNAQVHGDTREARKQKVREALHRRTREIYRDIQTHDREVLHLLRGGLQRKLAMKTEVLRLWIAQVDRVTAGSPYRRVKMRDIRTYWQRAADIQEGLETGGRGAG